MGKWGLKACQVTQSQPHIQPICLILIQVDTCLYYSLYAHSIQLSPEKVTFRMVTVLLRCSSGVIHASSTSLCEAKFGFSAQFSCPVWLTTCEQFCCSSDRAESTLLGRKKRWIRSQKNWYLVLQSHLDLALLQKEEERNLFSPSLIMSLFLWNLQRGCSMDGPNASGKYQICFLKVWTESGEKTII